MKKRLRDKIPFSIKNRLERFVARFLEDILYIAVSNGLDIQRFIKHPRKDESGKPLNQAWSVQDFLWLMDLISGRMPPPCSPDKPVRCSIIIPVFNNADYTFQCLRSLLREVDFKEDEIIVVNNAPDDETKRMLSYMEGTVRLINNLENPGIVHVCNQGAAVARGKYIVFLSNFAMVLPNWLKYLVETIEKDSSVGVVGSMLVNPDRSIQEAGGIVWRYGSDDKYGSGEDSGDRRYRYSREVDYCSGASLLARKDLFDKYGGFDERYAPAYYEDMDLCFGIRSLGYKVIYQPASKLIHCEGVAAGTNINHAFKRYQEINRNKFTEKWHEVMQRDHVERDESLLNTAADRRKGKRIIVFDFKTPTPDQDSGSVRMSMILKTLAKWGRVAFVPMYPTLSPEYEIFLEKEGIEIIYPTEYVERLKLGGCDIAVLSRPNVADSVFKEVRKSKKNIKIIFDTVDVHFLRLEREYKLSGDKKTEKDALHFKKLETSFARSSDMVWCVTPADREVLQREATGARIEVIPNIHVLNGRGKALDERKGLLFIGGFAHPPNKGSIHYFMKEIYPIIRQSIKDAKFYIVGSSVPEDIRAYHSEDVVVTGYVPNVDPYFYDCRVFVAPLRYGAGMKGKVGQALSYGVPVITTSIGAEGMGLRHGVEAMIADDPAEFAQAVIEVYHGRDLWQSLSDNGYQYIRKNFSPEVVEQKILEVIGKL